MSSERAVTVRIPGDVAKDLAKNQIRGQHWGKLYQAQQAYKGRAKLMWRQLGAEPFVGKVRLTVTLFRGRPLDPDGVMSALAPIVDGLKGEAFGDDNAAGVEFMPVRFVTGAAWRGIHAVTEVRIEAAKDDAA